MALVAKAVVPWTFRGQLFLPEHVGKAEGFVYLITNKSTGKQYVGRKYFWQIRKKKGKGRRVRSQSDWQSYMSSSSLLQEEIGHLGLDQFTFEIISVHATRGDTNYAEVSLQFRLNVLEKDDYLNDAIGKWRRPPAHIIGQRQLANTA